jgi:ubiquinone/menaquinone biosynthesis C-methylase UbiE
VSTESFFSAEELDKYIRAAGFSDVSFMRMMFGTIALHWGTK